MTSQELARIIEEDLARAGATLHWHGRPLRECLQEPTKRRFLNGHSNCEPEDLWLVFEEDPVTGRGYKIVYDDEWGKFGLAVCGTAEPIVISFHGGFVETLNAM